MFFTRPRSIAGNRVVWTAWNEREIKWHPRPAEKESVAGWKAVSRMGEVSRWLMIPKGRRDELLRSRTTSWTRVIARNRNRAVDPRAINTFFLYVCVCVCVCVLRCVCRASVYANRARVPRPPCFSGGLLQTVCICSPSCRSKLATSDEKLRSAVTLSFISSIGSRLDRFGQYELGDIIVFLISI